jgi:hypothetical protein
VIKIIFREVRDEVFGGDRKPGDSLPFVDKREQVIRDEQEAG